MTDTTESELPIAQLFGQSVVEGSARYWAAHFSRARLQSPVQAVLCFAHLMDQLTAVSPEVIAEKSVWWHEELTSSSAQTARHPVTQALLRAAKNPAEATENDSTPGIIDAMHRHLHGALMSQQQTVIEALEAWTQYSELRFGTLHEMLAIASGMPNDAAARVGKWTAKLHGLGVLRAPDCFSDTRILRPESALLDLAKPALTESLYEISTDQPPASAANQVLIYHELSWWKREPSSASPVFTGLPTGLRGMLASWRAARKAL